MTATPTRTSRLPRPPRLAGPSAPRTRRAGTLLRVAWPISPRALMASTRGEAAALAAGATSARLVWTITTSREGVHAVCRLEVEQADRSEHLTLVERAAVSLTTDPDGAHEHVEIPSLLSLTLQSGNRELVYAKTSVLTNHLALPGGVYDAPTID